MFNVFHEKQGWIEVICGCMYSGKSEELIRRLKRAAIAKQRVDIFKPKVDDRYIADYLVDEVLARQPEEIKDFLLQTSIMERFSGPLCDAVRFDGVKSPSSSEGTAVTEESEDGNGVKLSPPGPPKGGEKSAIPPFGGLGGP